jgi:hypothetical protein
MHMELVDTAIHMQEAFAQALTQAAAASSDALRKSTAHASQVGQQTAC